jgi:hypothetical protein
MMRNPYSKLTKTHFSNAEDWVEFETIKDKIHAEEEAKEGLKKKRTRKVTVAD